MIRNTAVAGLVVLVAGFLQPFSVNAAPKDTTHTILVRIVDAWFDESASTEVLRRWLIEAHMASEGITDPCQKAYWMARVSYLHGLIEGGEDREAQARQLFEEAIAAVETALSCDETSDARRLLADAYAQILPYRGPLYAIRTGRRIMENAQRAVDLDQRNVRANITLALSYLHAPPFAGGSVERAIAILTELRGWDSLERVERFSVNVWLAIALQKVDRHDEAEPYLKAAAAIYPGNTWVREIDG